MQRLHSIITDGYVKEAAVGTNKATPINLNATTDEHVEVTRETVGFYAMRGINICAIAYSTFA